MTINERIKAFVELGKFLNRFLKNEGGEGEFESKLEELIHTVAIHNPWFTEENVRNSLKALSEMLEEEKLVDFVSNYIHQLNEEKTPKNIAVIMAGNIPMVGFHDMLCVLLSGNKFTGKLSSEDKLLMPFISKVLISIAPEFANRIEFTEERLNNIEAVIATGSNNSARYFEYYFGKYPHIIRKNRNSVAVLTGNETEEDLKLLGRDIFLYFGLGCRNVSKLFVPKGYNFNSFYEAMMDYSEVIANNKYANNYEYNRTVYLMSSDPTLLDNNFLLLKEERSYSSPVGVLYYEYYDDVEELNKKLLAEKEQLQCIVSGSTQIKDSTPFGNAQCPTLTDYADGVDTMNFLVHLK